ncbi:MAG: hypothetical protein M1839_003968 [Geoglossum umbratile]|nr:MAG: hypothetical protein M1839_003968 [Geoglossum umbratile]
MTRRLRERDAGFFVLSAQSQVERLLPRGRVNPDDRDAPPRLSLGSVAGEATLKIFPPFVALRLDVKDRRAMRSEEPGQEELSKEMA